MTKDESKELFTRVMDRMVEARWLKSYTFTEGKGFHLTWTEVGSERAVLLKMIAVSFRLADGETVPVRFSELAQSGSLLPSLPPSESDKATAAFWREAVNDLGLHGDADGLLAMVHIVIGWAPDMDTPLKFGFAE